MAWETRDTTSDRQEMDDVTADATTPVAPSGGAQSLTGSPTYDAYTSTQMGRLSWAVALHVGASEPPVSQILTERLAESTRKTLESDSRLAGVEVIGLKSLARDVALVSVDRPVSVDLQKVIGTLPTTDGVILVSPVSQASYSELLKSVTDALPTDTLEDVPVLLGATVGTARYNLVTEMTLWPLAVYMKALPTQAAVFVVNEDFGAAWQRPSSSEGLESLPSERTARAGRELATPMERFSRQAPADPLANFAPMEMFLVSR